jgi:DNA-directed RNA polymerase specialized sigma24 family protein
MLKLVPDAARRTSRPRRDGRRDRIADALARCTSRDRELLALLVIERLTLAEAAVALDLSIARVRRRHALLVTRLARALAALPSRVAAPLPRVRMRRAS